MALQGVGHLESDVFTAASIQPELRSWAFNVWYPALQPVAGYTLSCLHAALAFRQKMLQAQDDEMRQQSAQLAQMRSILFGDTMVPNIEYVYILLLGYSILYKEIILLGLIT